MRRVAGGKLKRRTSTPPGNPTPNREVKNSRFTRRHWRGENRQRTGPGTPQVDIHKVIAQRREEERDSMSQRQRGPRIADPRDV